MASITNTAEGLTEGATPTTGNTGGGSGTACNNVVIDGASSITALAAAAIYGGRGYRMVQAAGANVTRLLWPLAESGRVVMSAYVRIDSTPTQVEDILGIRHASGNMGMICIGSDGRMVIQNAAGSQISASKSPSAITAGVYLVQLAAIKGTGSGDGTLGVHLSQGGTTIYTWESSAQNAGTGNAAQVWVGRSTTRGESHTLDYDQIRGESLGSGWIDHLASAPTIDVDQPAPNLVDLRGSTSGDGSTLTYPTPVELSTTGMDVTEITDGVWLIEDTTASSWAVTVAQADTQTDSDTVTVTARGGAATHTNAPLTATGPYPSTTWT